MYKILLKKWRLKIMKKNIGFIGLGIMGRPMTLNLLKAGHNVTVYDINKEAVDKLVAAGAKGAVSPKEVGENSDIIITMVPNSQHVREAVLGENGVAKGAKAGSVVIDMSSITPVASKQIAEELSKVGIEMLDAPVSGGEPGAIAGTLAIMVGGKPEVFEDVKDVLYDVGKAVILVGGNGCGVTAKLANQVIVNLNIAAMSEALVLAAKAGIDIDKMYQAIRGGLAGSAVLDAKVPLILERNFVAGGRIDINLKDITNVMETAHGIDVPLPLCSQLLEIMHALKVDGKAGDDHGGIVQYYEKLAKVEVRKEQ
jgi:2-hydroxy-3-oxopropionate reductase